MQSTPHLVLANVTLPDGRVADISVLDGRVAHTGAGGPADRTIDCTGLIVLPAAVDMHVHMRGGPQSAKEDWESGSKSALAGGVTAVVDQPNTIPPITTPGAFRARVQEAGARSLCHFAINSGVTADTPFPAMWRAGALAFGETFFAPSSYGEAVTPGALSAAFREIHACGALATIHAEEIGCGPDTDLASHAAVRPAAGEAGAVRVVLACNTAGCRIHFCHLSARESIEAAAAGSVEVTPHHLFLSYEQFGTGDPAGKVNPPLRSEKERKELWAAWDRIDVIASDHAPHTREEKGAPFPSAPSGIPGVETMVPLLVAAMLEKRFGIPDLIRKTSTTPAALLGIPPAGFLPGDRADFALYGREPVRIDPDRLHSRCGSSPFAGRPAVFPSRVIMGGTIVYEDDEFFPGSPQWFAGKGYRE